MNNLHSLKSNGGIWATRSAGPAMRLNLTPENKKGPEVNPVLKALWVVSTGIEQTPESLY
jgi:hypothetical protein